MQSRSKDKGATWQFEGMVYDHAKSTPGGTAYNPAYALAPDGTLILMIQTSIAQILKAGGERAGYTGYVYLLSRDNGKTYQPKGFVDPVNPKNVSAVTTDILTRNGTIYMVSNSYEGGCLLYTSQDRGETWQKCSAVFPRDDIAAPMHYPTLAFLPDGSLYVLGQARLPDLEEKNYTRVSTDDGKTWGPIRLAENLSVRHPVLAWVVKHWWSTEDTHRRGTSWFIILSTMGKPGPRGRSSKTMTPMAAIRAPSRSMIGCSSVSAPMPVNSSSRGSPVFEAYSSVL